MAGLGLNEVLNTWISSMSILAVKYMGCLLSFSVDPGINCDGKLLLNTFL